MKTGVIINPRSGRHGHRLKRGESLLDLLRRLTGSDAQSIDDVALTERAGHAEELARRFLARGIDRIVVWGGDGTINEVAGPMIGTQAVLGIVPNGSGDGLARSLDLPLDPVLAWKIAALGQGHGIDVGYLGGRHFLNVAGIGFDAVASRTFNARARRGFWGYAVVVTPAFFSYRSLPYRIELDGTVLEGPRFLVAFANGREYGNGLVLANAADLRDGKLDVVVMDDGSAVTQMWRARRAVVRPGRPARGIARARITKGSVSGERLVCHVDGETFDATGTIRVRVEERALRVANSSPAAVGSGARRAP